jgi:co-chaperonin GroES (HSP10)
MIDATKMMGGPTGLKTRIKGSIRPIHDDVLAYNMHFGEQKTKGGIIISNDDGQTRGIYPRWCQVYAKGHENKDEYNVGDWILVAHGRWSRGFIVEQDDGTEIEVRKIDIKEILAVSDEKPNDVYIGEEIDTTPDKAKAEDFGAR